MKEIGCQGRDRGRAWLMRAMVVRVLSARRFFDLVFEKPLDRRRCHALRSCETVHVQIIRGTTSVEERRYRAFAMLQVKVRYVEKYHARVPATDGCVIIVV